MFSLKCRFNYTWIKFISFDYNVHAWLELDNKLAFLDVCVTRINKNKIETSVYRKATNTNIYINWCYYAPLNWKTGILRNVIKRAKLVSSTNLLFRNEMDYIRKVFTENNHYPHKVVNHIVDQELSQPLEVETVETKNRDTGQKIQLLVSHSGKQGHQLVLKMKKQSKRNLPYDIKTMISYKSIKLSTKFPVKDKQVFSINITLFIMISVQMKNARMTMLERQKNAM